MASARLESLEQSRNGSLPPLRAPISLPDMTLHPQHPNQRIRILLALCFPPTADQTNQDPASHQASPPGRHRGKRPARRRTGPEPRSPGAPERSPPTQQGGRSDATGSPAQRPASRSPLASLPTPSLPTPSLPPRSPSSPRKDQQIPAAPVRSHLRGSGVSEPAQSRPWRPPAPTRRPLRSLRPRGSGIGAPTLCPRPSVRWALLPPLTPLPCPPWSPPPQPDAPFSGASAAPYTPLPRVPFPAPSLSLSLAGPASRHHETDWRAAERGLPLQPPPPRLEVRPPADPPLPARKWLPSPGVRGPGIGRAHAPARGVRGRGPPRRRAPTARARRLLAKQGPAPGRALVGRWDLPAPDGQQLLLRAAFYKNQLNGLIWSLRALERVTLPSTARTDPKQPLKMSL